MSKKYTAKEMREIMREVLAGALEHMHAIQSELHKLKLDKKEAEDPEDAHRQKMLLLTLTAINDIIHPAHKLLYAYFKGGEETFDIYVANQKRAVQNKLVPACGCVTCKESDASKMQEVS